MNLYQILAERAKAHPHHPTFGSREGKYLNNEELFKLTNSSINFINSEGIGIKDHISIVMENGPALASAFISLASGAATTPMNPTSTTEEFEYFFSAASTRALFIQKGLRSTARAVAMKMKIRIFEIDVFDESETGTFSIEGRKSDRITCSKHSSDADVALLAFTSGTTSKPKIVPLSHNTLCSSAAIFAKILNLNQNDRCLNVLPLFHTHGLTGAVLSSFVSGGSACCSREFSVENFFDDLQRSNANWYTAVPSIHAAILTHAEATPSLIKAPKLKVVRSSSSTLSDKLLIQLEKLFNAPVVDSYGMTEVTPICSTLLPPAKRKFGSVGISAVSDLGVFDEFGHELGSEQRGEICVKGDNVFGGYKDNIQETAAAFRDGWFRTGDQGYIDKEGFVFITGRLKEEINRAGEKISPLEIDDIMAKHEGVESATAFPVPHASLGEDVAIAIILKKNASLTKYEIREHLSAKLSPFKIPKHILFVDRVPRGPTGKVQRRFLFEHFRALIFDVVKPKSEIENKLVDLFSKHLNLDREEIGINSSFFALGGDSIQGLQIVRKLSSVLGLDISPADLMNHPSIEELINLSVRKLQMENREAVAEEGELALTAQEIQMLESSPFYANLIITRVLESNRPINRTALEAAIRRVLKNHKALRSTFTKKGDEWIKEIIDVPGELPLSEIDLSTFAGEAKGTEFQRKIDALAKKISDSVNGKNLPVHFCAVDLGQSQVKGLIIFLHHGSIDGYGSVMLCEDFENIYKNSAGEHDVFTASSIQPYAVSQRTRLKQISQTPNSTEYWTKKLSEPPLPFPKDFKAKPGAQPAYVKRRGLNRKLDRQNTKTKIFQLSQSLDVGVRDILIAATACLISRMTGRSTVAFSMWENGRTGDTESFNLASSIACIAYTVPVKLTIDDRLTSPELLRSIAKQLGNVPSRGIPWLYERFLDPDLNVRDDRSRPWGLENFYRDFAVFNFQGILRSAENSNADKDLHFKTFENELGPLKFSIPSTFNWGMIFRSMIWDDELILSIRYIEEFHKSESIQKIHDDFFEILEGFSAPKA